MTIMQLTAVMALISAGLALVCSWLIRTRPGMSSRAMISLLLLCALPLAITFYLLSARRLVLAAANETARGTAVVEASAQP